MLAQVVQAVVQGDRCRRGQTWEQCDSQEEGTVSLNELNHRRVQRGMYIVCRRPVVLLTPPPFWGGGVGVRGFKAGGE